MTISSAEFENEIENEWYVVRHSGEIPEIALCSALHFLVEDRNGPCGELNGAQTRRLVEAAELRYREIVLRDLSHENRGRPVYRGIKRSITNWGRYETFCKRQGVDPTFLKHETAAALLIFLAEEVVDVLSGSRDSSINCTFDELRTFAARLGLTLSTLPEGIADICLHS